MDAYGGGMGGDKNLKLNLADTVRLAWADEDLRSRLIFILKIFAIYVVGIHIQVPIPGIKLAQFHELLKNSPFFSLLNAIGGGGLKKVSIFALGLGPYITSSIVMQILTQANPLWKKEMQEGGQYARQVQNKRTKLLMLFLCVFQSLTFIKQFGAALPDHRASIIVPVILFWTAGSYFLLWLGEQLSEKGIGNGTSLLIFAGIIITFPAQIETLYGAYKNGGLAIWQPMIAALLFAASTWFVVYFTIAQRRIPIQHMRRQVGTKVMGGGTNYLPFAVNMVGVIPIIFAQALIYMPSQLAGMFPVGSAARNFMDTAQTYMSPNFNFTEGYKGLVGALFYMFLIFFFTYFYTAIQFNVDDISDNLKRHGSFIPGVRPGKQTRDFLDGVISRVTVVGALFLSVVALSSYLIPAIINVRNLAQVFGTSLLIMVSVALETMRQIEANLIMKQYGQ